MMDDDLEESEPIELEPPLAAIGDVVTIQTPDGVRRAYIVTGKHPGADGLEWTYDLLGDPHNAN